MSCIPLTNHISCFSTQVILTLLHLKTGPIYPGRKWWIVQNEHLHVVLCSILSLKYFKNFLSSPSPMERVCSFRTDDFITSLKTVGVKRKQEFDITSRVTWGIVPCTLACNKLPLSFLTLSLAERSMEFHECKIREISHCGWLFHLETLNTHEYNTESDDFSCVSTCVFL